MGGDGGDVWSCSKSSAAWNKHTLGKLSQKLELRDEQSLFGSHGVLPHVATQSFKIANSDTTLVFSV